MREKIAKIIYKEIPTGTAFEKKDKIANQILTLLKEEIGKSLLSDEEIDKNQCELEEEYEDAEITDAQWEVMRWRAVAQAQLGKTLKALEE